jgi:DNA-binding LytR/AlgR family response regulator
MLPLVLNNVGGESVQICICDDEEIMLKKIEKQINSNLHAIDTSYIINTFSSGIDLLHYVDNNEVEIVMLDIEVPDCDGFAIARKMSEKGKKLPLLIFITNRDDLVYDSFEYRPFCFIRKSHLEDLNNHLIAAIEQIIKSALEITVRSESGMINILVDDIIYIERQGRTVSIQIENEEHKVYQSVIDFESDLEGKKFIKINEGCIVNFKYISYIKDNSIVLKNGESLSISRRRKKETIEKFKLYMR